MKRFSKLLAGVTSAAIIFASTAALAAIPTDAQNIGIDEDLEVLGALGIMVGDAETGLFRPDSNLRRSEFAKIAVETLGLGDVADSNKSSAQFPDVVEGHWATGYINVAANQGLVIGDENGNFRPDDNVTYAEAVTVLVRMLGYEPEASTKGSWPTGHLVTGSRIGINEDVAVPQSNEPITRKQAAQLDFNSLTINLMEQTGYGTDVSYEEVDKTILKDKLDVTKEYAQITANSDTKLDSTAGLDDDEVMANSAIYKVGNTSAKNLLGYNAVLYSIENDSSDQELIVAREREGKNATLNIDADNVDSLAQGTDGRITVKYWINKDTDNSTKSAYIASDAKMIYNGKAVTMDTSLMNPEFGNVSLLDTNKDDEYDIVFVTEYVNYVVDDTSVSSFTISDKYGLSSFKLDPEDDSIDFSLEDKNGQPVKFEDLKEWNVLSRTESIDGDLVKVVVSTDSVAGKVTESSDDGIVINGTEYEVASNYPNTINVNDEGTFYLDMQGKIAAFDETSTRNGNYAYLLDGAKSNGISDSVEFKLYTKEGETKVLTSATRVQLNGAASAQASDVLAALQTNGATVPQLITYEVNSNGEITKINTALDNTASGNFNEDFSKTFIGNDVVYNETASKLGLYNVDSNTIVFDIPAGETDSDNYAIRTKDMFIDDAKYNVEIFDIGEDLTASVIIVTNSTGKTSAESPIAIVDKIAQVQNDRGEDVEKIYLMYNGEMTSYLGSEAGIFVDGNGNALAQGDIIQFQTDARGEIDTLTVLFDSSNKAAEFKTTTDDSLTVINGKVVKKFTNSINVSVNDGDIQNYSLDGVTIYKYDSTKQTNNVTVASAADISKYDANDPQTIFIRMYKDEVKEMVIVE